MAMGGAIRGPSDGSKVIGVLGFDFLRGCTVRLESRRRQSGSIKPGRLEVHVYPPGVAAPRPHANEVIALVFPCSPFSQRDIACSSVCDVRAVLSSPCCRRQLHTSPTGTCGMAADAICVKGPISTDRPVH